MEPIYEPSHASISTMKNFDSPNEHSSYYIKWLIGKSLSSDVKMLESDEFKAGRVEFDGSKEFWLNWEFSYSYNDEYNSTSILVRRSDGEFYRSDDIAAAGPDVPSVCRMAMMNKITGVTKYHSSKFIESTMEFWYDWHLSMDETSELDLPNGDYVVYCWIDLPTKVIGGDPSLSDPQGYFGPALLAASIASLFNNEVNSSKTDESTGTSDIVLITTQQGPHKRRFHCHRCILSVRWPVFYAMLTSERFKEGNEREVEIEDIDGDVMEIVLEYIYTGKCPLIDFDSVQPVLDIAEKYMLPELKNESAINLLHYGDEGDVAYWADVLAMSETYKIDYLKKITTLGLSSNIRAVNDTQIREKISEEAMAEVMDMAAKRMERSTMMEVKNSFIMYTNNDYGFMDGNGM